MFRDTTEYIAHIIDETGEIQPLVEHNTNVAKIMQQLCKINKWKSFAYFSGIRHDLGKYRHIFQKYIKKIIHAERGSIHHSKYGAAYAYLNHTPENEEVKRIASILIDSHHSPLRNLEKWNEHLQDIHYTENDQGEETLPELVSKFLRETSVQDIKKLNIAKVDKDYPFHRDYFLRYMRSLMTEADWSDTEKFMHLEKYNARPGRTSLQEEGLLDEIIKRCEQEVEKIQQNADNSFGNSAEVNKLRDKIQRDARESALWKRGSYVLNVPTGFAKTFTYILWALYHAKENKMDRIIIVLPYLNIIEEISGILKRIFGDLWVLQHHSRFHEEVIRTYSDIPTPHELASENWQYPVIITTSVQFFESQLCGIRIRERKLHSLANSIIIFDEMQVFPMHLLDPTVSVLKSIRKLLKASLLFSTATKPALEKTETFKSGLPRLKSIIQDYKSYYKKIERVKFHLINKLEPISYKNLLPFVVKEDKTTLVVFNTKRDTLNFFNRAQTVENVWQEIYYLSTWMCPKHRGRVLKQIKEDLKNDRKILVISTQLVEAGVDLDFQCAFRCIAPLDAIIQIAGRVNRNGKRDIENVYIFNIDSSKFPSEFYKQCAQHTKDILVSDMSILYTYNGFTRYHKFLMSKYDTDKKKIQDARKAFEFEYVRDNYKLIKNIMEPMFIWNMDEESKKLYAELKDDRKKFLNREDYRRIQPYCVDVYPRFRSDHEQHIEERWYGDPDDGGVCLLIWKGEYDTNKTGIFTEQDPNEED